MPVPLLLLFQLLVLYILRVLWVQGDLEGLGVQVDLLLLGVLVVQGLLVVPVSLVGHLLQEVLVVLGDLGTHFLRSWPIVDNLANGSWVDCVHNLCLLVDLVVGTFPHVCCHCQKWMTSLQENPVFLKQLHSVLSGTSFHSA